MSGDNDGILGVVVLMVLHIAAGLVSALLSISRLTLTGHSLLFTVYWRTARDVTLYYAARRAYFYSLLNTFFTLYFLLAS